MKKRAAAAQRGGCQAKACSPDARPTALWHVWPSRSPLDGKTVGDFAPDVWDKAAWISPNPGGVGPMTRAMLLSNVVDRAEALVASGA